MTSLGSAKGPETTGSALTWPTSLGFCQTHWPWTQASPFQQAGSHTGTWAWPAAATRCGVLRSGAK